MTEHDSHTPEEAPKPERIWRPLGTSAIMEGQLRDRVLNRGGVPYRQVLDEDFGPDNWRFVPEQPDDAMEAASTENASRSAEANKAFMDRRQMDQDPLRPPQADNLNTGFRMERKGHIEVSDADASQTEIE